MAGRLGTVPADLGVVLQQLAQGTPQLDHLTAVAAMLEGIPIARLAELAMLEAKADPATVALLEQAAQNAGTKPA